MQDKTERAKGPKRCAYCSNIASTRDHVPPKAILRKPFPQLITVPACQKCNAQWGKVDERFQALLSLTVGLTSDAAREFWGNRVAKGIRRGGSATRLVSRDENGQMKVSARDHDPMMERLIRGLTYAEIGIPLPPDVPIEAHALIRRSGERAIEVFKPGDGIRYKRVGPDFEYWCGFHAESVWTSFWLFRFYGQHYSMGTTGAAAEKSLAIKAGPKLPVFLKNGELIDVRPPMVRYGPFKK